MKAFFLAIAVVCMTAVQSFAGYVVLDDFSDDVNPAGNVNLLTRSVSFTNGAAGVGAGEFGGTLLAGGTATVSYTVSNPAFFNQLSLPTTGSWLTFVSTTAPAGLNVTLNAIGLGTAQTTALTLGQSKVNFLAAGLTSSSPGFSFTITNVSGGIRTFAISEIAATPEPASMLTAGAFALVGGAMYRRRAKKAQAVKA